MSLNHRTVASTCDDLAESNHTVFKSDSEITSEGSVGCSHALKVSVHQQVKLLEKGFTEQYANNQHMVKKLEREHPAAVNQSFQTVEPSIDCSSPTEQEEAAEVHLVKNGEAAELPKAEGGTGPVDEVDDISASGASRGSTYSTEGLNAIDLSHGADFGESLPEVAGKRLQSTSSEQPVGKEETCDSSYPTTPESSGLSLNRARIGDTALALTLVTEDGGRLLDTLVTSNCCEVDESPSQPEVLYAVGGFLEEIGVTLQSPPQQPPLQQQLPEPPPLLHPPPSELPPATNIDVVDIENVFPNGEPGFDRDSEPMTLGEGEPGNVCSICLDSHCNCALCPCGHYACLSCIDQWKRTRHPAPLICHICRRKVLEVLPF